MRVAIIPARGDSKRIPKKNIRDFCGQPMIAYSIKAAQASGLFDHVIVSTDNEEIIKVANSYGAETPFVRPKELANDHASTVPVIKHAIQWIQSNMGNISHVCCLYATAPMIQVENLVAAYDEFLKFDVNGYVVSGATFPFPIQRAFRINDGGFIEMFEPKYYMARSQDLEPAYQDAGQFYWGSPDSFLEGKPFFSTDSKVFVIPRHLVQDIDTLEDWKRAELMYEAIRLGALDTTPNDRNGA